MGSNRPDFSLMVHGGAGTLTELDDPRVAEGFRAAVGRVLEHGRTMLADGAPALAVVEACAASLEDDPQFNAGRGSVLNEAGLVEMDAAIMEGRGLNAGAVAGVHNIANPIRLARRVMDTDHVLLIGEGAMRFAAECGVVEIPDSEFLLPERVAQLERARLEQRVTLDHDADLQPDKLGTIGAIAFDRHGDLAAATSTGGMVNKRVGRVGDSPIIGAGVYADNQACAVSATGYGEDFMRTTLARTIAVYIEQQGLDAQAATRAGIGYLVRRVNGRGGVIVIDRHGRCAAGHTTPHMIHGWIEHATASRIRL